MSIMKKDAKIYVVLATTYNGGLSFKIINITDPKNPVIVGSKYYGGEARGVRIMEKEAEIYALVAAGSWGLKIIKITDPENPVLVNEQFSFLGFDVCKMV